MTLESNYSFLNQNFKEKMSKNADYYFLNLLVRPRYCTVQCTMQFLKMSRFQVFKTPWCFTEDSPGPRKGVLFFELKDRIAQRILY